MTSRTVQTPNGALPASVAREAGAGYMWSADGRRKLRTGTKAAAWELGLYCARAYNALDRFAAVQDGFSDLQMRTLAALDMCQAARQCYVLLYAMAAEYERLGLATSSRSRAYDIDWSSIVDPRTGETLIAFRRPDDWRRFADRIRFEVLDANGVDVPTPPRSFGAVPVAVWVAVIIVGGVLGAAALGAWSIGMITSYAQQEQETYRDRLACFDRWAEEYNTTGSERAREAMILCHEQAQLARPRSPWGALAFGLGGALILSQILSNKSED